MTSITTRSPMKFEALAQEDRVEVDMAGVTFIDSSGLSCLVEGLHMRSS